MRRPLPLRAFFLVLGSAVSASADPPSAELHVHADGFRSSEGHAVLRLYRPGDDVTGRPRSAVRAAIEDGVAQFAVADLAPGDWAAVVHHDRNDNGAVDHGWLGLPSEPLGFSGGFRLGVLSGKPTFAKLRFALAGTRSLTITVR